MLEVGIARWRLILVCTAIVTLMAGLVTLLVPKKYGAEMQFLVKNARQDLTLNPDPSLTTTASSELNETEVNSAMHLLLSRDLLKAVVLDTGLYRPYLRSGQQSPTPRAVDLAVMRLARDLQVSTIRKTNIIQASYRARDPQLAADVMKDLGSRYMQAQLSSHSTPGSLAFFSRELQQYRGRLDAAESATSAFRRSTQIFNADQQRSALVAQLEDVQTRLKDTGADWQEAQAKLAALTTETAAAPARMPADERSSVNSLSVDHLQTELAEMQNRRILLLMKFRPDDREVKELEDEIANTKRNLEAAKTEYSSETITAINPLHETLLTGLSQARINLKTLAARRAALEQMNTAYLAQLDSFDQKAVTLGDLSRAEMLDQKGYQFYGERMEAARAANQMDKDNFANVAMIETPVASPLPVWPVMSLSLLLGAFVGLVMGFSLAFIWPDSGDRQVVARRRGPRRFRDEELASPISAD